MDRSVLEKAWRVERDLKVRERILMVLKLQDGLSSYDVSRQHNCPHSKVLYWKYRFEEEGLTGLRDKPRSGRPPKVSSREIERIKRIVEGKEYTTATEVLKLVHEQTGVQYSLMHITRLLHSWGLSRKRPDRRHINAAPDEEVERFKKGRKMR
jgi:transposase